MVEDAGTAVERKPMDDVDFNDFDANFYDYEDDHQDLLSEDAHVPSYSGRPEFYQDPGSTSDEVDAFPETST